MCFLIIYYFCLFADDIVYDPYINVLIPLLLL